MLVDAVSTPIARNHEFAKPDPALLRALLFGYLRVDETLVPIISSTKDPPPNQVHTEFSDSSGYSSLSTNPSCNVPKAPTIETLVPEYLCYKEFSLGSFHHSSFFTKKRLEKGTVLGVYTGTKVDSKDMGTRSRSARSYTWEALSSEGVAFAIDGSDDSRNWLKYVARARNPIEQNVEVTYDWLTEKLVFRVMTHVEANTELLAWYSQEEWVEMLFNPPHGRQESASRSPKRPVENKPIIDTDLGQAPLQREENGGEGEEFTCGKCGSVFTYKYYLERHQRYTSCVDNGDREFVCKLCDRTFQKSERLRIHTKQVHEKIKPYKCTMCCKDFSQSSSLTKHMRTHTGSKPYRCPLCTKEFTASSILTTHLRQHTGERPFLCKICKRGFASHAAHHSHTRRSHGLEPRDLRRMSSDEICRLEEDTKT